MKSLWFLSILSSLGIQAARGSPVTSTSTADSNPSRTMSGASAISLEPSLTWSMNLSSVPTSQDSFFINGSTETANINGPVTVLKTVELIPQPVLSNSTGGASAFVEPTGNLTRNSPISASGAQQSTLSTVSLRAKLTSSSGSSTSTSPHVQVPQPPSQAVKRPKLHPIVVGGITYAPVDAHHTHSNADLPPVVVGGLTYRPLGKEFESGWQTSAPEIKLGSTVSQIQGGSMAANLQYSQSPGTSGPMQMQSPSITSPTTASVLVLGSQTLTAIPGCNGFILSSSTLLPGSPGITVSSTSYSLNPSATLTMGTSTFILATPGPGTNEGPSGTLTASNETFVPLGSTAVSIDGTTLSISGPAMTENGTLVSLASGRLVVGSFTFAFAKPAPNTAVTTTGNILASTSPVALSGQSVIPGSASIFVVENETFTAYPSGLAIDGTEVFEGSTAITVSGTPISLGSSDIVIGTSTIPITSITGLGPALSSGLSAVASTSGVSSGPAATNQSGKSSQISAAGQLYRSEKMLMGCFALIALIIVV